MPGSIQAEEIGKTAISPPPDSAVKQIDLVEEAIELKKNGVSDSTIVDHLYHLGAGGVDGRAFGNTRLSKEKIVELKKAGFQDDFIAKFEGHPQYVTLGIAAVWLGETAELTAAPMLRVFLVPKSYFKARRDYWKETGIKSLYYPHGLFHHDRWDLNFGITNKTSTTTDSNGKSEDRSYVLVGLSHELNLSALFNIGIALVPGDIDGKQTQWYAGITVDYNMLKSLGFVEK